MAPRDWQEQAEHETEVQLLDPRDWRPDWLAALEEHADCGVFADETPRIRHAIQCRDLGGSFAAHRWLLNKFKAGLPPIDEGDCSVSSISSC
jgi:hypothetical protein